MPRGWMVSHWILAVNGLVFAVDRLVFFGRLFWLGGKFGPAIWAGEHYRLLTSVFLHADLMHLLLNSYALYLFGPMIERAIGPWRFLVLYLLGGLWGSAASLYFSPLAFSIGASGAIFGLLGYLLFTRWRDPLAMSPALSRWVTTIVILNIAFTVIGPRIDVWGHFGGLLGGFLAGWVVGLPDWRGWHPLRRPVRDVALGALVLVALAAFIGLGVTPPAGRGLGPPGPVWFP
ncbi:MAG: rhomboid family intramembrane serine protease [Firmicutes bacterium]|nr:rhomboid family intramembrane serine protease [Bacillota bacterium]